MNELLGNTYTLKHNLISEYNRTLPAGATIKIGHIISKTLVRVYIVKPYQLSAEHTINIDTLREACSNMELDMKCQVYK